jgi:hypothetical protein
MWGRQLGLYGVCGRQSVEGSYQLYGQARYSYARVHRVPYALRPLLDHRSPLHISIPQEGWASMA